MIKILICDDMEEIRDYFQWVVDSQEDMQVVATASTSEEAFEMAVKHNPDVILMDVQMSGEKDGIAAAQKITKHFPNVKIIMLTIYDNDDYLIDSYVAGAIEYMTKETEISKICDTVRKAYSNKYFVGTAIAQKVKEKFDNNRNFELSAMYFINKMSLLTSAEWHVLKQLYDGKRRKEIALAENLSENTVKFHIRNILKKLEFSSSTEMNTFLKKIGIMENLKL